MEARDYLITRYVFDMPISFGAKIMYAALCNYAAGKDRCWPAQATLADEMRCSIRSVQHYLTELADVNLITIRHEQYRSCVYYLLHQPNINQYQPNIGYKEPNIGYEQPNIGYEQPNIDQSQENNAYLKKKEIQEIKKTPPLPPASERQSSLPASRPSGGGGFYFHDFEKILEAYPRKENFGFARAAYCKLKKSGLLPPVQVILDAIRWFMAGDGWQKANGRYIPYLSNWLTGLRWLEVKKDTQGQAAINPVQAVTPAQAAEPDRQEKIPIGPEQPFIETDFATCIELWQLSGIMRTGMSGYWLSILRLGILPQPDEARAAKQNGLSMQDWLGSLVDERYPRNMLPVAA